MTIEHGIIRLLLVISLLIVVPGAWISGEQFLEARTFHRWSTESGCGIPGSALNWCNPERRAEAAELAALQPPANTQVRLSPFSWLCGRHSTRSAGSFRDSKGRRGAADDRRHLRPHRSSLGCAACWRWPRRLGLRGRGSCGPAPAISGAKSVVASGNDGRRTRRRPDHRLIRPRRRGGRSG